MNEETWKEVDRYLLEALGGEDDILAEAVERSEAAGLPSIQVSTLHARFLMILARLRGARRILEIGTLGGYSTITSGEERSAAQQERGYRALHGSASPPSVERTTARAIPSYPFAPTVCSTVASRRGSSPSIW